VEQHLILQWVKVPVVPLGSVSVI